MRDFIIYANKPLQAGFSLNDLPGSGRVDLLARCVTAGLWLSHGIRDDVNVHLCVEVESERAVISFYGSRIKRVSPDERNIGSWIKRSLECIAEGKEKVQEGITVKKISLEEFLKVFSDRDIAVLSEDGGEMETMKDPIFILGDHLDLPDEALKQIGKTKRISLGPKSLLASHAIVLANAQLDKHDGPAENSR